MGKYIPNYLTTLFCLLSLQSLIGSVHAHPRLKKRFSDDERIRGVNIGGWLVLEPWITPSLFDNTGDDRIVDEYTFGQYQNYDAAHGKLVEHWNNWITEKDFQDIKDAGLTHVRIPIGYWAWDISEGEPYHQGQVPYLESAIQWARNVGLKVIIDLHGVPGSQNGFDNSGQRKPYPEWHTKQSNVERSNVIIRKLASQYSECSDVVAGITPVNEPAGFYGEDVLKVLKQYYYDSWGSIRYPYGNPIQGPLLSVISDAFQPLTYWDDFQTDKNGVIFDNHYYSIFSNAEVARSWNQHIEFACARASVLTASNHKVLVGEWSLASTDCAKYLNGRGVGARYDGSYPGSTIIGTCGPFTGSGSGFSEEYKVFLRQFWEAQVTAFEKSSGWIFWTWKAENADEWSYSEGVKQGWIPQDPNQRLYPNICG